VLLGVALLIAGALTVALPMELALLTAAAALPELDPAVVACDAAAPGELAVLEVNGGLLAVPVGVVAPFEASPQPTNTRETLSNKPVR
jgi:hypothetical protein